MKNKLLFLLCIFSASASWADDRLDADIPISVEKQVVLHGNQFSCVESPATPDSDVRFKIQFLLPKLQGVQDQLPYPVTEVSSAGYIKAEYCETKLRDLQSRIASSPEVDLLVMGAYQRGERRIPTCMHPSSADCWTPWEAFEEQHLQVTLRFKEGPTEVFHYWNESDVKQK